MVGGGGGVELPLVVFLRLLGDREREVVVVGTWAAIFVFCVESC